MAVEYITMIKDYKHGKHRRIKKVLNMLESKLSCAVCVERIADNVIEFKKHDLIDTQKVWKLN